MTNSTALAVDNVTVAVQNVSSLQWDNGTTTYIIQELDGWTYVLYMLMVLVVVISTFINALVFRALYVTTTDSMQSTFLIQAITVADILLSLALGTQVLPWILLAFGCDPVLSIVCYEGFSFVLKYILVHIQLCVGFVIAIDRLISVLRPLVYHTSKYSTGQKGFILGNIWIGIPVLHVIFNIIYLVQQPDAPSRDICFDLSEVSSTFYNIVAPSLAVLAFFATIVLYVVILGVIIRQRIRRRSLSDATQADSQGNSSLALTLLLVYLTYLLCYLPGIIQASIFMQDLKMEGLPGYNLSAYALTGLIYQLNTIIDPVIFTWRIRSVRNYMQSLLGVGMSTTDEKATSSSKTRTTHAVKSSHGTSSQEA